MVFVSSLPHLGAYRILTYRRKRVNIVLTTVPIGMLAQPVFTLTLAHTVATTIGFAIMYGMEFFLKKVSVDLRVVVA